MYEVIVPSPRSNDDFVELARSREYKGRHFRKHLLTLGPLLHPKTGKTIPLDEDFYSKLKANFDNGVTDIVAVPLADAQNQHSEDPLRNLGEVMDISRDGKKVYVDLDIRDDEAALKLGKTLLGASAFLSLDYKDTNTGQQVGPALLHACVTNRPYVTGLEDYQEVVAATADSDDQDVMVLTAEEAVPELTREELLAELRDKHGIDVEQLQAHAQQQPDVGQLTEAIGETLGLTAGGETISLTDVVQAVAELATNNADLSQRVGQLTQERAADEVDRYINAGRLLPKSRTRAIELALTDRQSLEDFLAPVDQPYVKMTDPVGVAPPQGEQRHVENIDAEVARLTEVAAGLNGGHKNK
jgi:Mu-like prophage I protein